ncbi:hypothetical protein GPECTOR_62g873 [Gonium pectorale]|uniref:Elongator complex protein 5 n=1 Tax=Gonium pectorale TaxID=33097 RepID=A0A150G4L1_GONPE|nr:hypothetical protein GPECTOR_62g873 [Gonium pectorale]|eukprot:KXZ44758.1 hypothetical protein GPECTOR_62g873 [Gonium pectorale]
MHPERVVFAARRLSSCTLELSALSALQSELAARAVGAPALAGRLDCRVKRRTGRVKVDSELYALLPAQAGEAGPGPYQLRLFPAPPFLDLPDPKSLVKLQPLASTAAATTGASSSAQPAAPVAAATGAAGAAAATAGRANGGGGGAAQPLGLLGGVATEEQLARAVGSSMRLTLTEEERRAKAAVVLPYQHQGQQRGPTAGAYAAGDHAAYLPPAAGGVGPAAGGSGQQALGHILYVRDSGSEADSDQELDEDLDI